MEVSKTTVDTLQKLSYFEAGNWKPIPGWARFFLALGASFSNTEIPAARSILAVSVPARTLAATLVGAGLVIARAASEADPGIEQYIQQLRSLPKGTPVIYRNRDRKFKAVLIGFRTYELPALSLGGGHIGLLTQQGTEEWVPIAEARCIAPLDRQTIRLPKRQKGRSIVPVSPLVSTLLDGRALSAFTRETCVEAVLVGSLTALQSEAENTRLARLEDAGDAHRIHEGKLGDLMRAGRFLPPTAAFRIAVQPSYGSVDVDFRAAEPPVCIFDGALSYIKWRREWFNVNHIIILDRTERTYGEAVREVNRIYDQYGKARRSKRHLPAPPAGIEMMYFEVLQ